MICPDIVAPHLLIFSTEAPALLYYTHLPAILLSLLVGFYIHQKAKDSLSLSLLFLSIAFSVWTLLDIIVWTSNNSDAISFTWSLFGLFYALIYFFSFYFVYRFTYKKALPRTLKIVSAFLLLPIIIYTPSIYNIEGFDMGVCGVNNFEGELFTNYYHFVGVAFILLILVSVLMKLRGIKEREEKIQVVLLLIGICLFLISFFGLGYYSSENDNFVLEQYSLLGMVIFMFLLGYLIVRYKAFDIKLIGAQALTGALIFIIATQFTFIKSTPNYILNSVALSLVVIAGYYLIKSIKQEVKRKEELEILSQDLAKANEKLTEMDKQKSEFISIASHQLRTPLTAIKGYLSLLLEGSYGILNKDVNDVLNKVYSVNDRLAHLVEDLLNVSRIEAGRIQYNFQPTQLADILVELHDMFSMPAKSKGLEFRLSLPEEPLPLIMADPNKIKEISSNLIDNAIKYTPSGSVTVSLEKAGLNARITIADTGIGIKPEDKDNLFTKFVRSKETSRMVVGGAGLGLFVGKSFVQAHRGNIWAESEGAGKGSQFIIELPIINPNISAGTVEKPKEA